MEHKKQSISEWWQTTVYGHIHVWKLIRVQRFATSHHKIYECEMCKKLKQETVTW